MAATTTLLIANDHMRLTRPLLAQILGYGAHAAVDDVLMAAMGDGPLLMVGPKGAGQLRLVGAIHETSLRRRGALVEISTLPESRAEQKQLIAGARVMASSFIDFAATSSLGARATRVKFCPSAHDRVSSQS